MKKPKSTPKAPTEFHVTLRQRKKDIVAQAKWKQLLICEAPPAQAERLYALVHKWNKKGIDPTIDIEIKKIQLEAAQELV